MSRKFLMITTAAVLCLAAAYLFLQDSFKTDGLLSTQTPTTTSAPARIEQLSPTASALPHLEPEVESEPVEIEEQNQKPELLTEPSPYPQLISSIVSPVDGFALHELPDIVYNGIEHDTQSSDRGHYGVDFLYYHHPEKGESILNTAVRASFPGRVVSVVEWYPETSLGYPYGNMLIIETPLEEIDPALLAAVDSPAEGSLYVLYAHMVEKPYVEMGEYVQAGQGLGWVGNTGDSDAPHLHWEMRFGPSDAVFGYMTYYNTRATLAQMDAYVRWRMSGEFVYFDPMLLIVLPVSD